jgi:hypothetical protein
MFTSPGELMNPACSLLLALSMAFSVVRVLVILRLESSGRVLIPHWVEALPPEARAMPTGPVPVAKR